MASKKTKKGKPQAEKKKDAKENVGWDSTGGIATRYGPDGPGTWSRWRRVFPQPSRLAMRPTH